jgi:hypothetical protein
MLKSKGSKVHQRNYRTAIFKEQRFNTKGDKQRH